MKILFVSQEYPPETGWGGIGTYVHVTAHALARRGHTVHVLSTAQDQRECHYDDDGVRVHRFGQIRGYPFDDRIWYRFPYTAERLTTAICNYAAYRRMRLDCDIIEAPNWNAEGLLFVLHGRKPVVTHIHSSLADIARAAELASTRDLRMAVWLERLCVSKSTYLSAATRASLRRGAQPPRVDAKRVEIIPHPMGVASTPPSPAGDAPPNVLFVGRLEARKNPEVIVKAASLVLKRVPDAQFIFVGKDNGMRTRLLALAQDSGVTDAVRFEGWKTERDIVAARTRARVCVVPSRWESFGLVVTEAMAAGRPVVASRIDGFAEIVKDGETGKLVDPDDPREWADAIIEFLSNPHAATAFGGRAREEIQRKFDPEIAAMKREALYSRAICEHRVN